MAHFIDQEKKLKRISIKIGLDNPEYLSSCLIVLI